MQKLRNYVNFFHRARLIILLSLNVPARQLIAMTSLVILVISGRWPWFLTSRPRKLTADALMGSRETKWLRIDGARKITRSKSVSETWWITFDYVVEKDMWGQEGPRNRDTRHMSRSSIDGADHVLSCDIEIDILYTRFNFRSFKLSKWRVTWNARLETSKSSKQTQNISILRNSQIYE